MSMSKILIMLLLSNISVSSFAGWERIAGNDEITIYIDKSSIRRDDVMVKVWLLDDYRDPQKTSSSGEYLSSIDFLEFDCKAGRRRIHEFVLYSGYMGRGSPIFTSSSTPGSWSNSEVPGSIGKTLLTVACQKK